MNVVLYVPDPFPTTVDRVLKFMPVMAMVCCVPSGTVTAGENEVTTGVG